MRAPSDPPGRCSLKVGGDGGVAVGRAYGRHQGCPDRWAACRPPYPSTPMHTWKGLPMSLARLAAAYCGGIPRGGGRPALQRRHQSRRSRNRPTLESTISREVACNGRPDGYRAVHAHQATRRRERRHKLALSRSSPPPSVSTGLSPEAVRGIVDQFAARMISQMVMTTLPPGWPPSRYRSASGVSTSGYVLSMTGVSLPASISSPTVRRSS